MKITKLEQSGFIIESANGQRLALDIAMMTPLEKLEGVSVDAMLVSHLHGDHFSPAHIQKISPKKVYLNKECIDLLPQEKVADEVVKVAVGDVVNIGDMKVTLFDVDHGPNTKVRPKENFGFLIEVDGQQIYFAGDMFYPSGIDVASLEVDYALIPVGTFYTFGPQEALAFARQFKKIGKLVPMHYEKRTDARDEFVKLAEEAGFSL